MLPSRGLPRMRLAQLGRGQAMSTRSISSRQFSAVPRTARRPACPPRQLLDASAVRHASWYAPWSWGSSSSGAPSPPEAAFAQAHHQLEPQVTSATPGLAPAGTDSPAVLDHAAAAAEAPEGAIAGALHHAHDTVEALVEDVMQNDLVGTVADTTAAITKHGALKEMGLDYGWGTSAFFEWLIEHIYLDLGLGWGVSIMIATIALRTGLFRFQWKGSNNMAKMASVAPYTKMCQAEITAAKEAGNNAAVNSARMKMAAAMKEVGVNPVAAIIPVGLQMVFGFGAFRCLRGMATLPVPEMAQGGLLWFQDLTVSDPYYVLPLLSGGIFYAVIKAGGETGANVQQAPEMKFLMQNIMPLGMTLISIWQPAAIQIYLVGTAALSALTATLLRSRGFRRMTGLVALPTPESTKIWDKVARGEIPLNQVLSKETQKFQHQMSQPKKMAYQAPNSTKGAKVIQNRGLNIKADTALPTHLKAPGSSAGGAAFDRDADFATPPKGFLPKVGWIQRNYAPKLVYRRTMGWFAEMAGNKNVEKVIEDRRKASIKQKAEEYEARRRERLRRQ